MQPHKKGQRWFYHDLFHFPLDTQQALVAQIESEQQRVTACRELLGLFEAKIQAAIGRVWGEEPTEEPTSLFPRASVTGVLPQREDEEAVGEREGERTEAK